MALPTTLKQCDIKIRSLKKQVSVMEKRKKSLAKKKPVKKKVVKKAKRRPAKKKKR